MRKNQAPTASRVQAHGSKRMPTAALALATITPAFLAKLEDLLADTQYLRSACGLLGLPYRTFQKWKHEGASLRDQKPLDQLSPRERVLVDFCNAVERGIARGEINDLHIITAAARGNWRAAAWRLERRAPQRWGGRRGQRPASRQEIRRIVAEMVAAMVGSCRGTDDELDEVLDEAPADHSADHDKPALDSSEAAAAPAAETSAPERAAEATIAALAAAPAASFVNAAVLAPNKSARPDRKGLDAIVNDLRSSVGFALGQR